MHRYDELTMVDRLTVNRVLRLEKNASYRLWPRAAVRGRLRLADVRRRIEEGTRNGATLPRAFLVIDWMNWSDAARATSLSRPQLRRLMKRVPHFVLSGKNALIDPDELRAALV